MNFQAASHAQGVWFENLCRAILIDCGFTIDGEHVDMPDAGVEVDLIATNRHAISFYSTCKGSYRGQRPGVQRTDTLKKALAEAQALHAHGWSPILLLTSHLPNTRTGRQLLASMDPEVLFDAIDPLHNARRLRWLAQADEEALRRDLESRRSLFTMAKPPRGYAAWPGGAPAARADQPTLAYTTGRRPRAGAITTPEDTDHDSQEDHPRGRDRAPGHQPAA